MGREPPRQRRIAVELIGAGILPRKLWEHPLFFEICPIRKSSLSYRTISRRDVALKVDETVSELRSVIRGNDCIVVDGWSAVGGRSVLGIKLFLPLGKETWKRRRARSSFVPTLYTCTGR